MKGSSPNYFFRRQQEERSLRSWTDTLPNGWVDSFLQDGLQNFLKRYGYVIHTTERVKLRLIAWAWSHVFISCSSPEKGVKLKSPEILHNGDSEEFDYYCHMIDYEEWETFMDKWQIFQWLDDSDAGFLQRSDFQYFVWSLLNLSNSPSHHRWCDIMDYQSDDSDKDVHSRMKETEHYDHAYGGDRRTL